VNTPRVASAAVTGVATGIAGSLIPIVALTGGLVMQIAENDVPSFKRLEHVTEGVVDGSVALLTRMLFRGSTRARGLAMPKPRASITRY